MSEEIPLFPLSTILFPGGPLVLRIFEARYLDLVKRCMRDGTGFGVVQIREGQEAGGPALTFDVGTYARIVDFSQQPDGLLGIRALGNGDSASSSGAVRGMDSILRMSSGCLRTRRRHCPRPTPSSAPRSTPR
jgi:hypothetical protein